MTSLVLLIWIALGIAVQAAVWLGIVFWKHWQGYQALRLQAVELSITPPQTPSGDERVSPSAAAWPGLRPFRVERKVIEDINQTVCSFYLAPLDGRPLPALRPGQFLTFSLQVPVPGGGTEQLVRCYSLSDAPARDHYRISVKRVPAPPGQDLAPGRSSNFLHDHIQVGDILQLRAPVGHFHLDRGDSPVVLIAGGIGITPMFSMLDWCLAEQPGREVWLFYGIRNSREVVMLPHLEAQAAAHPQFKLRLCFSDPLPEDLSNHEHHVRGRVDVSQLRMLEQGHDVLYYENTEGGHGGAADNEQRAMMQALEFSYLWQQLERDKN